MALASRLVKQYRFLILVILQIIEISANSIPNTVPNPELCASRKIHSKLNSTGYFFSWLEPDTKRLILNWFDARSYCQVRCMELISLESLQEIAMLKKYIQFGRIESCWTSGRLCDFQNCEKRADLRPLNVNGWFWSGSGRKMHPTTEKTPYNDWSHTGGLAKPQPDNREGAHDKTQFNSNDNDPYPKVNEACMAYLNNAYKDAIKWHDLRCHYAQSFACEDSPLLLKYARYVKPHLNIL